MTPVIGIPLACRALAAVVLLGCGSRTGLRVGALDASAFDALDAPDSVDVSDSIDVADIPAEPIDTSCLRDPSRCDDRSVCTVDTCQRDGTCAHVAIVCDDRDPCTANTCDTVRGCIFPPTDCRGCADGLRDAFRDLARYPRIAGCAGGFAIPGLSRATSPTCGRGAGDDGANPDGRGCTASDLCAPGWHVCLSVRDVATHSPDGCRGASDMADAFFATRQTGPGCAYCASGTDPTCGPNDCRVGCAQSATTTNDIFGCGTLGGVPQATSCTPLDRFSNNLCSDLHAPWRCDADPAGLRESDVVVKPGPAAGGVLCCED